MEWECPTGSGLFVLWSVSIRPPTIEVLTRPINTHLTQESRVADGADAREVVHLVDALARVSARIVGALVDVSLAVASWGKKRGNHVRIRTLWASSAPLIVLTSEALGTGAVVVVDQVNARGSVLALTRTVV